MHLDLVLVDQGSGQCMPRLSQRSYSRFFRATNSCGGAVPQVGTFREGVGRKGRRNVRQGKEGISRLDEAKAVLTVEFPWSRMFLDLAVVLNTPCLPSRSRLVSCSK